MGKSFRILSNIIFSVICSLAAFDAQGQRTVVDSLINRGDSLRKVYRFDQSIDAYNAALRHLPDSLLSQEDTLLKYSINEKLTLSENGKSMCSYVYTPGVVAKKKFSTEDFFLYYPLKDKSWRATPNQLDSVSGRFAKAVYAPEEGDVIYFSAYDGEGIRNIYKTALADTLWTVPALLNEQMTSISDDVYPMLSPDGKKLYFASEGLYGVGGYDLYVSEWDESSADWSVPVNMGFPYSSPANDLLLINSTDGKYTVFASDRDCQGDSLWVYVLEYDNKPVRSSVSDPEELLRLSLLEPASAMDMMGGKNNVKSDIPESDDTRMYMTKMAQVRALRDSISVCESSLAECREKYMQVSDADDRHEMEARILQIESRIPVFQAQLDASMKELQRIEMNFLSNGVVIDPARLIDEAAKEVVATTAGFTFSKNLFGKPLDLVFEEIEPEDDYTFQILDTAKVITGVSIPEGIVYQIQILTSMRPTSVQSLKGLSPVFETVSPSGRYIYRVGLFNTYKDVISHLNAIKKLGFKSAYVVAFVDGQETQVNKARTLENERKKDGGEYYRVMIIPAGEDLDSVAMSGIRQQADGKDIAKNDAGYLVGPFEDIDDASNLVEFIEVMGYGEAKLEKL